MRNALAIPMAIILSLVVTSVTFGETNPATSSSPAAIMNSAEKSDVSQVKIAVGATLSVDPAAHTITVASKTKDKTEEIVITLDEKTRIVGGTLADIKNGNLLKVAYKEADGKNIAMNITFRPANAMVRNK